jgi:hypothetical protein
VLIVLITLGIGAVFYFTGDMMDVSDELINAIRENDLDPAFSRYYEAGVDLSVIEPRTPQFSPELRIDEKGVLAISGIYPTQPSQYHFKHKYIYEGLGRKLLGYSA